MLGVLGASELAVLDGVGAAGMESSENLGGEVGWPRPRAAVDESDSRRGGGLLSMLDRGGASFSMTVEVDPAIIDVRP